MAKEARAMTKGYHRLTTTLLIASTRCYMSWVARLMTWKNSSCWNLVEKQ